MSKNRRGQKTPGELPAVHRVGAAEQIDQRLAAAALEKNRRDQKPTLAELRALRRVTAAEEERKRWEFYATIPKKHYCELSGRHVHLLNRQAEIHGIPVGGRTIDLGAVLRWLHDFLAKNEPAGPPRKRREQEQAAEN